MTRAGFFHTGALLPANAARPSVKLSPLRQAIASSDSIHSLVASNIDPRSRASIIPYFVIKTASGELHGMMVNIRSTLVYIYICMILLCYNLLCPFESGLHNIHIVIHDLVNKAIVFEFLGSEMSTRQCNLAHSLITDSTC